MDKLAELIKRLRERVFPRVVVRVDEERPTFRVYLDNRWQVAAPEDLPEHTLFGQAVMLIPDDLALFRLREFPGDHVARADLYEAVELDVANWNPWDEPCAIFYWPTYSDDGWQVAIWIWQSGDEATLRDRVDAVPTHVLPEMAWRIATVDEAACPAILLDRDGGRAAVLDRHRTPLRIQDLRAPGAEERFWLGLEEEQTQWPVIERVDPGRTPSSKVLRYARSEGVKDWTDPVSWARPAAIGFGLYFFWLLGSTLVTWQKMGEVSDQVQAAQRAAIEVVEQREHVTRVTELLTELKRLRERQAQFIRFLAVLSETLPEDAWIEALQYTLEDDGTVDLDGRAQRAAGLAALLEALPEVRHAGFLGDIRRDNEGLEPFRLRVTLNAEALQ